MLQSAQPGPRRVRRDLQEFRERCLVYVSPGLERGVAPVERAGQSQGSTGPDKGFAEAARDQEWRAQQSSCGLMRVKGLSGD